MSSAGDKKLKSQKDVPPERSMVPHPKKNKRGRPNGATDLRPRYTGDGPNAEITERVCKFLRAGQPRTHAAVLGGISFQTMQRWMNQANSPDEPDSSPYKAFALAIEAVEGEMISECTNVILQTMMNTEDERLKSDNAKWMLEHRFARHFTKHSKTEISGPDGEPIKVENRGLDTLSTDELLRIASGAGDKNQKQ